jgi:hypothetical protein
MVQGARVDLAVGCTTQDDEDTLEGSDIEGAVIRATLVDDDGQRASFDIPLLQVIA